MKEKTAMTLAKGLLFAGAGLVTSAALYGCAAFPTMQVADPNGAPREGGPGSQAVALSGPGRGGRGGESDLLRSMNSDPQAIPGATPSAPQTPEASPDALAALVPDQPIDVVLTPQPVGQFLEIVFTTVLKVNYSLGPGIGTRSDIIQLNQPPTTSKKIFIRSLQSTLRNYGLRMSVDPTGRVQVTEQGATQFGTGANAIIRTRDPANVPPGNQRVNVLFQLVALRADGVQAFLEQTFQNQGLTFTADDAANAFIIQGPARAASTAVAFLHQLDVPAFAGAQVVRLQPVFYSPDNFAQAMASAMSAEGYIIGTDPLGPKSIVIVPLPTTNQTLVFAADSETMARVQYYAAFLDQPSQVGDASGMGTWTYDVHNTSAASIGAMLINAGTQAAGGRGGAAGGFAGQAAGAVGQPGGAAQVAGGRGGGQNTNQGGRGGQNANNAAAGRGGRGGGPINAGVGNAAVGRGANVSGAVPTGGIIAVDDAGNRILFTGSPSQYASLLPLLRNLDKPPRQVLVEVTVAEVTLNDTTQWGLEWFFSQNLRNGSISGGTQVRVPGARSTTGTPPVTTVQPDTFLSGLGLGNQGLTAVLQNGDLRGAFNAFASNNKVNILSTARLPARSGVQAGIQVGTSVPTVSASQTATGADGTPVTSNSIIYRDTGVILNITPTIYSDEHLDIQVYQEISDVTDNPNPDIDSPFIPTRNINTTLNLSDGRTAVLGGAIQDRFSKQNAGIPFLKDIPILGTVFRVDSVQGDKTELVVLITPFIIRDDQDMTDLTRQITTGFNQSFQVGRGSSYTLTPFTGANVGIINPPDRTLIGGTLQRPSNPSPPPEPSSPSQPAALPPAPGRGGAPRRRGAGR